MSSESKSKLFSLTPHLALELISPFFEEAWPSIDPDHVIIEAIQGGYCNSIFKVTRSVSPDGAGIQIGAETNEPTSVIIRIRGGNMIDVNQFDCLNTYNAIMIVTNEMSRRNLGPKLYGMFSSDKVGIGSVEEYIIGHTLTPEESADPIIMEAIARQLAKVHAIKGLPLKLNSLEENLSQVEKFGENYVKIRDHFLNHPKIKSADEEDKTLFEEFDILKEKHWLEGVIKDSVENATCRINFGLMDLNFLNLIVRDEPESQKLESPNYESPNCESPNYESRIFFIDYDAAQYNLRGLDFASYFFGRVVDGRIEGKIIPGAKLPSREEKVAFFKHYQAEIKRLNAFEDFDENGVDSVDNLLKETLIGTLQQLNFFLGMSFTQYETFLREEDNFYPLIIFNLRKFYELKSELISLIKQ